MGFGFPGVTYPTLVGSPWNALYKGVPYPFFGPACKGLPFKGWGI